ncbi:MAG: hypothetical protein QXH42_02375 [Thermoplasmata archaeon]
MSRIRILPDRQVFIQGGPVEGTVRLELERPAKLRALTLSLMGAEIASGERPAGKHRQKPVRTRLLFERACQLAGEQELLPGTYEHRFSLPLELNGLPSYEGKLIHIRYTLHARASIPLWPDIYEMTTVTVALPPGARGPDPGPIRFYSDRHEDDSKPSFSVELPRAVWRAGEELTGRISIITRAGKRVRKARVALARVERSTASGELETNATHVSTVEVPGEALTTLGTDFALRIPPDATPSYRGFYSELTWGVLVELDVALGFDVSGAEFITVVGA